MKTRFIFTGRLADRYRSLLTLLTCAARVRWRRLYGRPLVPEWSADFEAGNLFVRAQFNHALSLPDVRRARAYFDSLYGVVTDPEVQVRPTVAGEPRGDWFIPRSLRSDATLLYLHGGGYTFYAAVSRHFIAFLADRLGMRVFAPDYRLTPEHPHPAQLEDGLAAYRYLLAGGVEPRQLVLAGDSAGGHLALMMLARLNALGLPQPALGAALSPWTDIGRRGPSQFGHDRYDMVQGCMTLQFAQWLKGDLAVADEDLSPVHQDYRHVAPLYLQAGGKEILVDMIRDFSTEARRQGARVRLDVWPHMTHEFQAYGDALPESREALRRLGQAIDWALSPPLLASQFPVAACTEQDSFERAAPPSPLTVKGAA